jgi:hypothetical protein
MIRLESRGIADLGVLAEAPDGDRRLLSAKVEALMLRGNALADVGRGALLTLSHLTQLDLSHNRIETLEGGLPPTLRSINLAHNRLAQLGDGIAACVALTYLDVSGNRLTSLRGLPYIDEASRSDETSVLQTSMASGEARVYEMPRVTLVAADNLLTSCRSVARSIGRCLHRCDLRGNKLRDTESLHLLLQAAPKLAELDVRGNPAFASPHSRAASVLAVVAPPSCRIRPSPNDSITTSQSKHASDYVALVPSGPSRLHSPSPGNSAPVTPREAQQAAAGDDDINNNRQQLHAAAFSRPPQQQQPQQQQQQQQRGGGLAHLDVTLSSLRDALLQLEAERDSSARLREQLRAQKRRGDDLAANARARGEALGRAQEDLNVMSERCDMLQRKLHDVTRQLKAAEAAALMRGRPPQRYEMSPPRPARAPSPQSSSNHALASAERSRGVVSDLASLMVRNLSPIAPSSTGPPQSGAEADDGAARRQQEAASALHAALDRVDALEAAVAERDEHIERLAAENADLAATAQRLIQEKLAALNGFHRAAVVL